MKKYDFILFEDFYVSINHYKDLVNIAKLLKDSGYNIAIADVFKESEYCNLDGVPVISIGKKISFKKRSSSCKILSVVKTLWDRFRADIYLVKVIRKISPLTRHIYAGTMFLGMPSFWLNFIPSKQHVFFWGLRSYILNFYKVGKFSLFSFNSWRLSRFFKRNKNVSFFVSDKIIRKEFLDLGFESNRLVIRPERFCLETDRVDNNLISSSNDKCIRLLCIGSLRPQKRIDLIIEALRDLHPANIQLIIAGKASYENGYEKKIEALCENVPYIERLNKRLSEEEYINLIDECDYLILCDEKQLSSITNGTMNEALISGKPIIAPNYNPYKSVVEEFLVGILYDLDDIESIKFALSKAEGTSPTNYVEGIKEYKKTLQYDNVLNNFKKEVHQSLSKEL